MTAKEMFEALGYEVCKEWTITSQIRYKKWDGRAFRMVYFFLDHKLYRVMADFEGDYGYSHVGIDLNNAIQQQMKELGWIE